MDTYAELLLWAERKGIEVNGVKPQVIPGRERLLTVPIRALRTLETVPETIQRKLPKDISLHSLLAVELALDKSTELTAWKAVVPTLADFEAGVPLLWPPELQALLPKPAKDLLDKQQGKLQREWAIILKAFPGIIYEQYLYAWLLINSRTFYYTTPQMERFPHDDRLALLPVADLFNHADNGCEPGFSRESYGFTADRTYGVGEEVHICYGKHTNDFLLAEYGFVLADNQWDAVCIDDVILPNLTEKQKTDLDDRAFLGKYMLDAETAGCHRTQVALRLLCCTRKQWIRFINAEVDKEATQRKVNSLLKQMLDSFMRTIRKTLEEIKQLSVGLESQRELLAQRWEQIETMVIEIMKRLDS